MVKTSTRFFYGEGTTPTIEEEKKVRDNEDGPSVETLNFIKEFAHSFFSVSQPIDGRAITISLN
ncbi:MAG: hypothetical protein IK017_00390 [Paludibacteraceae bacterium]|nr:hypothetical protein [Paludibacteraceae bacterium]MBO7634995.1 hypothetical protein [Paludibacteraceae bacterium]MBR5971092.1 hypothetical protein [Paludibacteraceae bacterium]